jgi:hypothetical protein
MDRDERQDTHRNEEEGRGKGKEKEGSPRRAPMSSAQAPSRRFGFFLRGVERERSFGLSRGREKAVFLGFGRRGHGCRGGWCARAVGDAGARCSVSPARRRQGAGGATAEAGWAAPGERSPVGRVRWGFGWAAGRQIGPRRGRGFGVFLIFF